MKNKIKPITCLAVFYGATLLIAVVLLWKTGGHPALKTPAVAIVSIEGPIQMGDSLGVSQTNPRELIKTLRDLEDNPRIRAVVIRINSPGGSVAAVQEIDEEVHCLRSKGKVLVASMGDVAASGGYYIAAGCNRIVADPGTLTGSIGVILEVADAAELMRKVGLRIEAIKSGAFKDAGSPFRPLTAEERHWFQGLINQAYEQFLTAVSTGRKIDRKDLLPLADGRVFTGELAKTKGLVDLLGSEQDAIREANRLIGVTDEKAPVLDLSEESPLNRLMGLAGSLRGLNFKAVKPSPRFDYIWE